MTVTKECDRGVAGRRPHLLSDPGGVRRVLARWVIEAELRLKTATRLGGRASGPVDMPVLRDACSGAPLLTGSTLAGALRSCLADRLSGYRRDEPAQVAALFGASRGDDQGQQSPLIVFDSLGALPSGQPVEIRDCVKIDGKRGTAEAHKKFDGEVLPAGTTFPIRLELLVPGDEGGDAQSPDESQLLSLLAAALEDLASGEIALGARRSRGMGRLTAWNWRARRFDLRTPEGWLQWLVTDPDPKTRLDGPPHDSIMAALGLSSLALPADRRVKVRITADLAFAGGLLVRSPTRQPDAPDVMHLQSGGRSVLPGTSLAGVLRNRALRIARFLSDSPDAADRLVDGLFGPQLTGTSDPRFKPQGSRLRISESVVDGGIRQRPTRIRIDRFTQGVFENALYDEEPDYGGHARVVFELRGPRDGELGLVLLLVKDLLSGDLAVGGTASVGRGVARGTAELAFFGGEHDGKRISLDPAAKTPPTPQDLDIIDNAIRQLHLQLRRQIGGQTP